MESDREDGWDDIATEFDKVHGPPRVGNMANRYLVHDSNTLKGKVFVKGVASEAALEHELRVLKHVANKTERLNRESGDAGPGPAEAPDGIAMHPLHTFKTRNGNHIIVFQYFGKPMNEKHLTRKDYASAAYEALERLHKIGVIHGDLKEDIFRYTRAADKSIIVRVVDFDRSVVVPSSDCPEGIYPPFSGDGDDYKRFPNEYFSGVFLGNLRYASIMEHLRFWPRELTEWESFAYMLLYANAPALTPWVSITSGGSKSALEGIIGRLKFASMAKKRFVLGDGMLNQSGEDSMNEARKVKFRKAIAEAQKAKNKEREEALKELEHSLSRVGSKAALLAEGILGHLKTVFTENEAAGKAALCTNIKRMVKSLKKDRHSLNPLEEAPSKPSAAMMTAQANWNRLPAGGAKHGEDRAPRSIQENAGLQQLQEGGKEGEKMVAMILREGGYSRGRADSHDQQYVDVTHPDLQVVFPTTGKYAEVDWMGHGPVQKLEWCKSWEITGVTGKLGVHPLHFSKDNVFPNPLCTRFPGLLHTSNDTLYIVEEGVTNNEQTPQDKVAQIDYKVAAVIAEKFKTINPLALLEADIVAMVCIYPLTGALWDRIASKIRKLEGTHTYIRFLSWLNRAFLMRPDDESFANIRQRCLLGGAVSKAVTESSTTSTKVKVVETKLQAIEDDIRVIKANQDELLRRTAPPEEPPELPTSVNNWLEEKAKPVLSSAKLEIVRKAFASAQFEERHLKILNEDRLVKLGLPYAVVLDLVPLF